MSQNKNFYISIAGVMGSGKTTISRILSEKLSFHLFEENFAENIFLPRYYQNPPQWAFHSQLFYLREKASQLTKVKALLSATSVVQDTPLHQDIFTYAKAQYQLGYMSDDEFQLYLKFYQLLSKELPTPDLVIQLDAAIPVLEERIRFRGREYEKNITAEYLKLLCNLQNEWLEKNSDFPVIRIRTDNRELDIVGNPIYQEKLLGEISSVVNGAGNRFTQPQ